MSPDVVLWFGGRGVILNGGPHLSDASFDTLPIYGITYRWNQIDRAEPIDPWPHLRIEARERGDLFEHLVTERGPQSGMDTSVDDLAAAVEAFMDELARRRPMAAHRGWLAYDDSLWEPTDGLPADGDASRGAYRSAAPAVVIARSRGRLRLFGLRARVAALAAALGTAVGVSLDRSHVSGGDVAVTHEHVYAHDARGPRRIPLASLRGPVDWQEGNVQYRFGRRATLRLKRDPECPVQKLFDAKLGEGRDPRGNPVSSER